MCPLCWYHDTSYHNHACPVSHDPLCCPRDIPICRYHDHAYPDMRYLDAAYPDTRDLDTPICRCRDATNPDCSPIDVWSIDHQAITTIRIVTRYLYLDMKIEGSRDDGIAICLYRDLGVADYRPPGRANDYPPTSLISPMGPNSPMNRVSCLRPPGPLH